MVDRFVSRSTPAILISVLAISLMITIAVSADESDSAVSGKCGGSANWSLDNSGNLVISGSGPMYDYESSPFAGMNVRTVAFTGNVTYIGSPAFEGLNLTNANLKNVDKIGEHAFAGCSQLLRVDGFSGSEVQSYAFSECGKLGYIDLRGTTTILSYAFDMCYQLESPELSGVSVIMDYAFRYCDSIEVVHITRLQQAGDGIFEGCSFLWFADLSMSWFVPDFAFKGCSSLEIANAPSASSIYEGAFSGCKKLEVANMPNAKHVWASAFEGCSSLKSVPANLEDIGARAFRNTGLTDVVLPYVTDVDNEAFYGCSSLVSASLPAAKRLGDNVFYGCSSLKSFNIPSVESVGKYAFRGCTSLEQASVPAGLGTVPAGMFRGCSGLESVTIPSSASSIQAQAFYRCTGISSISIPSKVSSIADSAFEGIYFYAKDCSTYLGNSAASLAGKTFTQYDGMMVEELAKGDGFEADGLVFTVTSASHSVSVTGYSSVAATLAIPSTVEYHGVDYDVVSIGTNAFYGCKTIKTLVLPDTMQSIGSQAFYGCSAMTSADLGGTVSVGTKAFARCSYLKSVDVGDSLKTVSAYGFFRCSRLASIDLEDAASTFKSLGSYAFDYCDKLGSIAVPSFVTAIGKEAFSLRFVDESGAALDANPASLGGYIYKNVGGKLVRQDNVHAGDAFAAGSLRYAVTSSLPAEAAVTGYTGSVTRLAIPSEVEFSGFVLKVTSVADYAFKGCSTLLRIELNDVKTIGSCAFYGCKALKTVIMDDVETVGIKAFANCVKVNTLRLGDDLKTVRAYAFYGCKAIQAIDLPDTVTSIGSYAFANCSSLASADLGESLTTIGAKSFQSTALQSLSIPATLKTLDSSAFQGFVFMLGSEALQQDAASLRGHTFSGADGTLTAIA